MHAKTTSKVKIYKCLFCSRVLECKSSFKNHIKLHGHKAAKVALMYSEIWGLQEDANDSGDTSESFEDTATIATNILKSEILGLQNHANNARHISESLEDTSTSLTNTLNQISCHCKTMLMTLEIFQSPWKIQQLI